MQSWMRTCGQLDVYPACLRIGRRCTARSRSCHCLRRLRLRSALPGTRQSSRQTPCQRTTRCCTVGVEGADLVVVEFVVVESCALRADALPRLALLVRVRPAARAWGLHILTGARAEHTKRGRSALAVQKIAPPAARKVIVAGSRMHGAMKALCIRTTDFARRSVLGISIYTEIEDVNDIFHGKGCLDLVDQVADGEGWTIT